MPARVVAEHRGRYVVDDGAGERPATLAGRLRHHVRAREDLPATGDWVALDAGADGAASIHAVLPRRGAFLRKAAGEATEAQVLAANVDVALIATALPADLSERRIERYLALAWESGAVPVVLLTKADLAMDADAAARAVRAVAPGVDVAAVSSVTGDGLDALGRWLRPGRTAVLLGSSGVGKSTLANRLMGGEVLRTGAVREDGKGRHTTTHRQLLTLASGALLIDTPGMRELQLWSADTGLDAAFADVEALAAGCRFADCGHDAEPGCAVRAAAERGALDPARLASWQRLRRELAWLATRQDEAAAAQEKARVRSIHRAQRAHYRQGGKHR
ncbi:ribosome small subunit-dependent GTPase A [Longimicrobium sp.]|uniref:ribosome small subunit-dependent GTPase A n=1 Tax=Longimicrobium sp. TaxID=2029185 RepID=UPI002E3333C4|nr:ribosome small subunit-dependent GTPase A [Longimicrobium sp.]HEX6041265.1 ribosome small subunit-dependent GTPase A [Longimicrobium sp.]